MKKTALGLVLVFYAFGVMVTWGMFTFNSRYDCYSKRGTAGILWCPDTNRSAVLDAVVKSFFWPYYAASAALKTRESLSTAGRRPPR